MTKEHYTRQNSEQAINDFFLSKEQIKAIRASKKDFWVICNDRGEILIKFEDK